MKIENRDPHGVAIAPIHNSGTPRPTPNSGPHHDPRAGGQIPQSQYSTPVPIKNGGQE